MRSVIAILSLFYVAANAQKAIVVFTTGSGGVAGNCTFTQNGDTVTILGVIENLKPGDHGFHVHEKGDLTSGCASTGGHYNPYKKNHGGPADNDRHIGDLGNIKSDNSGLAHVDITDKVISLTGPTSIIGRAIVIHSDRDDLGKGGFEDSKTTGHAGTRVACGIIGTLETELLGSRNSAKNFGIPLILMSVVTVFRLIL